jgi:hypothetical protein
LHCVFHFTWIRTEHIWFIVLGYIKHESVNDRRFQQSCEQFISAGWWLKVTISLLLSIVCPILPSWSALLMWLSSVMQHTILRRWHIQIHATDWHIWHWAASIDTRELRLCILVATTWIDAWQEGQLDQWLQEPRTMVGPQSTQSKVPQVKCPKEWGAWLPR